MFTEISQLMLYGYSVVVEKNVKMNVCRLKIQKWNAKYDNHRFSNGIYNIDRLSVKEFCQELKDEEMKRLNLDNKNKFNLSNLENIVLDGLDCELSLSLLNKKYTWNIDDGMNEDLSKCIQELRIKACCQQKQLLCYLQIKSQKLYKKINI